MYMYAMRQKSVLKGMGARFKIYMLFFPVSYLGLSALLPARLPIDTMYNNFIMDRIHARNCRPCLAQYGRRGGGGERYLMEKREG